MIVSPVRAPHLSLWPQRRRQGFVVAFLLRHLPMTLNRHPSSIGRIISGNSRMEPWRLALAVILSLAASLGISACVSVQTYTQPSLVRVIDASYVAPAVNVLVATNLIAGNLGQGAITNYATVPADPDALISITAATGGTTPLVTTHGTLLAGHQHSILLADNGAALNGYEVTILEDQQVQAAGGHSAFRFLNQAPRTGAVDVYMLPAGVTLANATPIVTALDAGAMTGYISFTSQTVTMVITPTGQVTPKYSSTAFALIGGEARTVLIYDTQLSSDPPVTVTTWIDAGPTN